MATVEFSIVLTDEDSDLNSVVNTIDLACEMSIAKRENNIYKYSKYCS